MSKLKPQINPKLFIAALSTGAALVLSAATSAGYAQGGFVGNSGSASSIQKTTTAATGVIKKRDLLLR